MSTMETRMSIVLFVALICVVGSRTACADPTEALPGVKDLTPANFDNFVNGHKLAFVEFYAPWCGHCKRLTPELKLLGEKLAENKGLSQKVVIAKVDADEHRDLGERFDVRGFPTLLVFPRGKDLKDFDNYSGPRTADAILEFLDNKVAQDSGFGRIASLDELAKGFISLEEKNMRGAADSIKASASALEGEEGEDAALYVKVAEKIAERGPNYVVREIARLERMLVTGNVAEDKATTMTKKLNILAVFHGDEL